MNKKRIDFDKIPFVRVSKPFARKHGTDVAVLAAEFDYWSKQMNKKIEVYANNGYFFYESSKIQKATGLSDHRQRIAREKLRELEILHIQSEKKGIPPKNLYYFNEGNYKLEVQKVYEQFIEKNKTIIDNNEKDNLDLDDEW